MMTTQHVFKRAAMLAISLMFILTAFAACGESEPPQSDGLNETQSAKTWEQLLDSDTALTEDVTQAQDIAEPMVPKTSGTKESAYTITEIELEVSEALAPSFGYQFRFSDGMFLFYYSGKYGYMDESGKVIIEPKYDQAAPFSENRAVVYKNSGDNLCVIDKNGNEIFNIEYNYGNGQPISDISYRQSRLVYGDTVYDTNGKIVYSVEDSRSNGTYSCDRLVWNNKAIRDLNGIEIFSIDSDSGEGYYIGAPPSYYGFAPLSCNDDIFIISKTDDGIVKYGAANKNGEIVVDCAFERLGIPGDGRIPFMRYGKWGYIDYTGQTVVEPQYKEANEFVCGRAVVTLENGANTQTGYIDVNGEWAFDPVWRTVYPFSENGIAVVQQNNSDTEYSMSSCLIDGDGNVILSRSIQQYSTLRHLGSGVYYWASATGECGVFKIEKK